MPLINDRSDQVELRGGIRLPGGAGRRVIDLADLCAERVKFFLGNVKANHQVGDKGSRATLAREKATLVQVQKIPQEPCAVVGGTDCHHAMKSATIEIVRIAEGLTDSHVAIGTAEHASE